MAARKAWRSQAVADWEGRGQYRNLGGWETFTVDVSATGTEDHEPLLVVHGFPTSSFDFRLVLPALSAHRRVLLLDLIGFGLSAKPDQAYTMNMQADVVQAFVAETGVERINSEAMRNA